MPRAAGRCRRRRLGGGGATLVCTRGGRDIHLGHPPSCMPPNNPTRMDGNNRAVAYLEDVARHSLQLRGDGHGLQPPTRRLLPLHGAPELDVRGWPIPGASRVRAGEKLKTASGTATPVAPRAAL